MGIAHGAPGRLVTLDRQGIPTGDIHANHQAPGQGGMTTLSNTEIGGGNGDSEEEAEPIQVVYYRVQ